MSPTPRIAFALLGTLAGTSVAAASDYLPEPDLLRYAEPLTLTPTTVGSVVGLDATDPSALTIDTSSVYVSAPLAQAATPVTETAGIPKGPKWPVFENGVYIVGYVVGASVEGDFNGDSVLLDDPPTLLDDVFIDNIDTGVGFGFGLGYRLGDFAFELSYQRTYHDHSFLGVDQAGDAVLNVMAFDFKWYFLTDTPLQPFAMVGALYPWLEVDGASVNATDATVGDATFRGLGLSVGGGVNFYITPRIALVGAAGYRYMFFNDVKSHTDGTVGVTDNLLASGFFAYGGVSYTF